MMLIKGGKSWNLVPQKVGEEIALMLLDKFFDYLGCIEKDAVWWIFKMKDLIGKIPGGLYI